MAASCLGSKRRGDRENDRQSVSVCVCEDLAFQHVKRAFLNIISALAIGKQTKRLILWNNSSRPLPKYPVKSKRKMLQHLRLKPLMFFLFQSWNKARIWPYGCV
ncbi:hypothetical protein XENORESO_006779 [Xenotaenia resolanae]|uniref:Uncharacterized protein n=1 Tax=Xenotaenia resolanae TaxID=208358 RepID=A0ABV0WF34_9TELE